jgi:xylulokinase
LGGSLLLGVDIGTSGSKAVLCSPDGQILATAIVEHETSFPHPGWAEHDAEQVWWGEFVQLTREILAQGFFGDDVGAVGVSAIGPCVVPLDAAGTPLRPGILYGIDSRASDEIAWLEDRHGIDTMAVRNGMRLTSQAMGPKIRWMRTREPDVFARTAMIHTSSSYMVFRLTGEHVIDRHSASYFAPLFDWKTGDWCDDFAADVIELDRLPRIVETTSIAGTITTQAAAATGLRPGTPVSSGTIDAAAEGVSGGAIEPGDMLAMYGSTMFFLQTVDQPQPDPRLWIVASPLPGTHQIAGSLTSAGLLTKWLRDEIGAETVDGEHPYQGMARLAAQTPPGADGLLCLPYFAGERAPIYDPQARGIFAGLSLRHTRGHLFRAAYEATGFGMRHNLDVMREMGAVPERVVAVGGGTQNSTWLQIVSDVTGVPQMVPERAVGASYGDAFLAGLASGIVPDSSCLNNGWVRPQRVYEPNPALYEMYSERYDIFRRLYETTKDDIHALARSETRS